MVPRYKGFDVYQDELTQLKEKLEYSTEDELGTKLITEGLEFLKQSKDFLKQLQETPTSITGISDEKRIIGLFEISEQSIKDFVE